jgi:hypothetical protein
MLYPTWNYVGVPLNDVNMNASTVLANTNGICKRIAWYDAGNGGRWYQWYTDGGTPGGTNFNLQVGQGYVIRCSSESDFILSGTIVSNLTSDVYPGWNLLAWTNLKNGKKARDILLNDIPAANRLSRYLNDGSGTELWEMYYTIPAQGGTNFDTNYFNGYFIMSDQKSKWTR